MHSYIPVPIFLKKIARWVAPKPANLDGLHRRDFKRHYVPLLCFSDENLGVYTAQINSLICQKILTDYVFRDIIGNVR
jgi:hypothetical protein